MTLELLRCERIATPLTWEPVTPVVNNPGPIVCVENHATFRTLLRVLRGRESPPWVAVAWVQGRNTAPLESLADLPFLVTRLDYLGDLDAAGLEIAITACATAEATGVPAGPAAQLWELLVARPPRQGRRVDDARVRQLVAWLPEAVRERGCVADRRAGDPSGSPAIRRARPGTRLKITAPATSADRARGANTRVSSVTARAPRTSVAVSAGTAKRSARRTTSGASSSTSAFRSPPREAVRNESTTA